jgi:predicted transcriptional regulator
MGLTDQLREAMDKSELSLYEIAKRTKTGYAAIHGFAHGQRGMTLEVAERLMDLFRMRVTAPKQPRKGKKARG